MKRDTATAPSTGTVAAARCMRRSRALHRGRWLAATGVLLVLLGACGEDGPVTPPGNGGGGGPGGGPFDIFDIFMRPRAIQRASDAGGLPTPQLALYNLSAFFQGGAPDPVFDWQLDAALGTVRPKAPGLGIDEATVSLLNPGTTPLGFYDITVDGTSGSESDTFSRRIAVMENTWMKHQRVKITSAQSAPAALTSHPTWMPGPGGDSIVYIESPTSSTADMRIIEAYRPLNEAAQAPGSLFLPPPNVPGSQVLTALEVAPDVSPAALGRDEILFSSQMDVRFTERCPGAACNEKIPFNIWVVKRPQGISIQTPKVLTHDSTFVQFGQIRWWAFDYIAPRWDPSASGSTARIAFFTTLSGTQEIWLADLVDLNGDASSDTLMNYRQLTDGAGAGSFAWHPEGQFIYFTSRRGIEKVDVASGAVQPVPFNSAADSLLSNFTSISVFKRAGGHTLLAFQATLENSTNNIYVFDEDDSKITPVLPFESAVTHLMFPRWHPTKMQLVYISDYSVAAWSDGPDPTPIGNPVQFGTRRTAAPSMWSLKFED